MMNSFITKTALSLILLFCLLDPYVAGAVENHRHSREFDLSTRQKAELLLLRKQFEKALEVYQSLLKDENADSVLFRGLVKAYAGAEKLNEAGNFIKDYLATYPGSSAGQYGLGYFYYLKGDDSSAQRRFAEAVRLLAGNALAWNNWGASLSRTKSYNSAVKKVKEAIRLNSSNPMYYNNLRRIYGEMGSAGLFIADYKRYVKEGPRLVAQGYGRLLAKTLRQESFKQYSQGNLDGAIEKLGEIVVIFEETGN